LCAWNYESLVAVLQLLHEGALPSPVLAVSPARVTPHRRHVHSLAVAKNPQPRIRRVRVPWMPMDLTTVIETRPGVRSGKPCFIGTRVAVYDVLDYLASGMTTEGIVADFPELTPEHVRAAIEFAALRERRLATA
jgi:uncharacterized protein (DUF433 family)